MEPRATKRIGFISTRIAGTDGVSLEIAKWAEVLTRNGHECFYFAGELDRPEERSFLVPAAHFEHPEIKSLHQDLFGKTSRKRQTSTGVQHYQKLLKNALTDFREQYDLELLIPENALTIPMNIPLGLALTEFIAETGLPAIAHHHDFAWERPRFLINACQDYLDMAFPCNLPSVRHVVINSQAARQLSFRRGISNTIIPNVYNFAVEPPAAAVDRCALKEQIGLEPDSLFILQPTRIVPRKWIERSLEIVHYLRLDNPTLVISHPSGDEGDEYQERIREYAQHLGVKLVHIDHLIAADSRPRGTSGRYSIADIYHCADLVTYPSGYEGFGNAFLEAIYFKKPIIVNRYAIFITDIEPHGFEVVAFDGFVTSRVMTRLRQVLEDGEHQRRLVEKNFRLGKKFFSYEILEERLLALLASLD